MKPMRRAVIDVGTNSVKLLVADVMGTAVEPVKEKSEQTRLGRGFYASHVLQPEAIAETAHAVKQFRERAESLEAEVIRVIATSAARDASNQGALLQAIEESAGLKVEVISGEKEADLVFRGVMTDERLQNRDVLIMDVGGGSTELIVGSKNEIRVGGSFSMGTVRMLEKCKPSDPPTPAELESCRRGLNDFIQRQVFNVVAPHFGPEKPLLVGTGGTATILARLEKKLESFEREQIEGTVLDMEQVSYQLQKLWSLPQQVRQQLPGLPSKRADVILTGVAIYQAVMEQFSLPQLFVSTRGLRFAAVMGAGGE